MKRLLGVLKIFRRDLLVLIVTFFRRGTPLKIRVLCVLAAAYLISPVDILPDAVPLAGLIDDAIIVPGAMYGILNLLPNHLRQEGEQKADRLLKKTLLVALTVTGIVAFWAALVVYGIYRLLA